MHILVCTWKVVWFVLKMGELQGIPKLFARHKAKKPNQTNKRKTNASDYSLAAKKTNMALNTIRVNLKKALILTFFNCSDMKIIYLSYLLLDKEYDPFKI